MLGYDVDAAKLARLGQLGGRAAGSVAEIARACRRIVLAVFNTDQVEEVIEGPHGVAGCAPRRRAPRHGDLRQHLRPRPHRRACRALAGRPGALRRGAGLGQQRPGRARRGAGTDRRRGVRDRRGARRARRDLSALAPPRGGRQRRPREARDQPDTRREPRRARGGPRVRRAHGPRSGCIPRRRARFGGLFAGDGHQGRGRW